MSSSNQIISVSVLLIFFLTGCTWHKNEIKQIRKFSQSDKFKNTLIRSQFFKIQPSKDNIVKSKHGSIIIIPMDAFLDREGNPVRDSVQIEFAEAFDLDDMILSNLIIQDSTKIIETHSAFFINASKNGEQLLINKLNPLYIEIPARKQVQLYKGIRDTLGNMSWNSVTDAVKYLLPVPFELLNFYPENFENEIQKGLPFRSHTILTTEFTDSLYYGLTAEINNMKGENQLEIVLSDIKKDSAAPNYNISCINPASIKAIRTKKFQNTSIATREFEARLKAIFKTCDNSILELYINNLNKNLWEIDQLAADKLGRNHKEYSDFMGFASLRQTKVEVSDKKAELLSGYYLREKGKIEKEIQNLQLEFISKRKKLDDIAQYKIEKYKGLLQERFEYRMKKFGFELTDLGWYNAADEIELKDVEKFKLNVEVSNGKKYERVYTYVVNDKIKSIFSLLSTNNIHFDLVFLDDPVLLLWKNQKFNIISIGYNHDTIAYKICGAVQKPTTNANLILEKKSLADFKKDIKEFTWGYNKANKIMVDLEYQEFFYKENKRKKTELEELIFKEYLLMRACPCNEGSVQVQTVKYLN